MLYFEHIFQKINAFLKFAPVGFGSKVTLYTNFHQILSSMG